MLRDPVPDASAAQRRRSGPAARYESVRGVIVLVGLSVFAGFASGAQAATIRALPLPAGATISTEADRAAVTANAHGDVAATITVGVVNRIIVWSAAGGSRVIAPPRSERSGDPKLGSTQDAVVAPDGAVYGIGAYPFSGAYSGTRTGLYAWRAGVPRSISGPTCSGAASDVHPTAVAPDGRVALAGGYDSAIMNLDSIEAGEMAPTASVLDGATCRALDFGWISALDGGFAAGRRGYQNGKPFPANVNSDSQTYVAVRWSGSHADEIGPGVALGVNARGDCVGSDALPATPATISKVHAVVWHGGTITRLSPEARRSVAYAINESGRTVVGTLYDGAKQHAVRWRDGKAELLDALLPAGNGWQLLVAYSITPDGAIVGVGRHSGALAAFVLSAPAAP